MTPDERLDEIEQGWNTPYDCRVCIGLSPSWDGHDRSCRGRVWESVPWLIRELRDAREGKPFRLCDKCLSDLEAPMCEDCYRRSGPLAAANSARDAAIDQLADANREIAALVKHVNDLCDVRDAAIKAKAELRDARAEIERLNLVVAAMDSQADENITEVLALTADRDHWRTEWEDADAKRITAEAELAAERAKVERAEAVADEWDHREYVRMPEDFAATLRGALTDECDS